MRRVSIVIVVVAAVALSWMAASLLHANAKIAKEAGKKCTYCHGKTGKPELNEAGKCYKEKKKELDECIKADKDSKDG